MATKLTVYFDDPFWVGVFEKIEYGLLETSRVVFGAEPKDYEVYVFILENYYNLKFSRAIKVEVESAKHINPKRLRRTVKKETSTSGIGTKAQQAIKLEHETRKLENKKASKKKHEELEQLKFEKGTLTKKLEVDKMNKEHWNSLYLDGDVPDEIVKLCRILNNA
jgi:predicted DNA-binding protein (MmcQ/YjbR family)